MSTPTPRGYTKMYLPLLGANEEIADNVGPDPGYQVVVLSCHKCGALVLAHLSHNKWHHNLEKGIRK
jgi:hypothetical protein